MIHSMGEESERTVLKGSQWWSVNLYVMVSESFTDKVGFEQRLEGGGKEILLHI